MDMPPAVLPDDEERQRQLRLTQPVANTMPPAISKPVAQPESQRPPNTLPPAALPLKPPAMVEGQQLQMPPAMARANQNLAGRELTMPAAPKPAIDVPGYPDGRPQLTGWKKALDTVGKILPWTQAAEREIPGTPGNFDMEQQQAALAAAKGQEITKGGQDIQKNAQEIAQAPQTADLNRRNVESEIADRQSEIDARGNKPAPNDKKVDEGYNAQGQRVTTWEKADGSRYDATNPNIVQKPPEEAGKLAADIDAQVGAKPTTAQYGGKTFPSVAAAVQQWGKDAERIKNDEAAAGANARGESYGRNRPVQVLDTFNGNRPITVSSGEAEDNPNRYVTQSGGEKSLPKEALINDIRTSAQNVEKNIDILDEKGFDRAKLATALADPTNTFESYLQGLPRGSLSDKEQQFVSDLFNLREQAMAMRSVLGAGGGSEDVRKAILNTLPGVSSGSSGFGKKQIANLTQVLDRLERGVPTVPLNQDRNAPAAGGGGFAQWKANQANGKSKSAEDGK